MTSFLWVFFKARFKQTFFQMPWVGYFEISKKQTKENPSPPKRERGGRKVFLGKKTSRNFGQVRELEIQKRFGGEFFTSKKPSLGKKKKRGQQKVTAWEMLFESRFQGLGVTELFCVFSKSSASKSMSNSSVILSKLKI